MTLNNTRKNAPFAASYMMKDGSLAAALSPYRYGVGWLFSSVLLMSVFGDTVNKGT